MLERQKKGLSTETIELYRKREREKECEDGATRIVCSLTSAINFRNENFYSCFPFDLFYLRKYKTFLSEAREEEEEKKKRKILPM